MKMINATRLIFVFLLLTTSAHAQYIQVNDAYTPQQLVQDVLINNSCATVSNISVTGGDFGTSEQSYGYFSGTGTTFPFQAGIILSTGRARRATGPNTSLLDDGGNMGWGGDSDLELALQISTSVNATVLEFDFVPLGNRISFDYMLSSEEYHDNAPCSYSDGFAFLLKENNTSNPYTNLAVVPGTNIPVKVTSVRPQIGGSSGCDAQNPQYFGGFNGTEHPTNFNGQTTILTAQANVITGRSYHIKLVIADEGNYRYDSAIFIGAGSFSVTTDLGPDRSFANNNPLCTGDTVTLNAETANALQYEWFKNGTPVSGQNGAQLTVTSPGEYSVAVQLTATCFSTGKVVVEYAALPPAGNYPLIQCDEDGDGLAVFNLTLADALLAGNAGPVAVSYYTNENDAANGTNAIASPASYQNTGNNQVVYALVSNPYGCSSVSTVTLSTSTNSLINPPVLEECDDEDGTDDGFTVVNLTQRTADITDGLPANLLVQYFTSFNDALLSINPVGNPSAFTNTVAGGQTIYARIYNGSDCFGIVQFPLVIHGFGGTLRNEQVIICSNTTVSLNAGSGFETYSWNTVPVQNTPVITVNRPGTYIVTVTNIYGCKGTKTFTVTPSGPPESAIITVKDFAGNNNAITINAQGPGVYQYSLDNVRYQDSSEFTNLDAGKYTVYIKDVNGCGPTYTDEAYVLDYPKYFTPNGDRTNDFWRVPYLNLVPGATITIYNRYGKVITAFKGNSAGWDGNYNGQALPSDDYWFVIQLNNNKIIKGHFALIR